MTGFLTLLYTSTYEILKSLKPEEVPLSGGVTMINIFETFYQLGFRFFPHSYWLEQSSDE